MELNRCVLGEFIELRENINTDLRYGVKDVRGVNNLKELMPTKADISGRDLSKFQIVYPGEFVFNHRTSRNGSKFSIAFNDCGKPVICTEDYVVFRIKEISPKRLLPEWLYMYFNRPEFDRYVITNSWGSSTEFYNWEDICAIKMILPPVSVQQKYVKTYKALLENQHAHEQGLIDLKMIIDATVEREKKLNGEKTKFLLGEVIEQRREKYDGTDMQLEEFQKMALSNQSKKTLICIYIINTISMILCLILQGWKLIRLH